MEHEADSRRRLSREKKAEMGQLVHGIKHAVEHNSGMDVHNAYKSGSVKKGTALGDSADTDLVLTCNTDQSTEEFAKTTKPQYMDRLQHMADSGALGDARVTARDDTHTEMSITHKGTPHKVDFTVSRRPEEDRSEAATRARLDAMTLESKETQKQFNLEYTQQQTDVIRGLPPKAKDVIREVKEWKEDNNVPLKSYGAELLVKKNLEEMGGGDNFDRPELTRRVYQDLAQAPTMNVTQWKDSPSHYQQYASGRSGPVLADPVNPLDNVAPSAEKAHVVAEAARKKLQQM